MPKLHRKFQMTIETDVLIHALENKKKSKPVKTKQIMVVASKECIDSVVNMNVLFLIEKTYNIKIIIVLKDDELPTEYKDDLTPTFYGYDNKNNVIWKWERAPEVIKNIEKNSKQHIVIVEKKKYRYGGYLQSTLDEIIFLL